eukprot:scaffold5354_cov110-Cylindrotheca_fusiformis.AAC.2
MRTEKNSEIEELFPYLQFMLKSTQLRVNQVLGISVGERKPRTAWGNKISTSSRRSGATDADVHQWRDGNGKVRNTEDSPLSAMLHPEICLWVQGAGFQ